MKLSPTLIEGKFLKRYKRFFADFLLNEKTEVAHVANTGSMKSCNDVGARCLVSPSMNPERKLKWTLEAVQAKSGAWVGVNTARPNHLVKEAFEQKVLSDWQRFSQIRTEVKINSQTRLDFLLESNAENSPENKSIKRYVEVKNVTMANGQVALFPDAVTERGQKHLQELMQLMSDGHEAEILFTVQRSDCEVFSPADEIDPEYGKLLRQAKKHGLIISAYLVKITPEEIVLTNQKLKVKL